MCQPPGKKLATLSLLSGGEQTLTALALIFGVFLANPAPICVLDEVDAPLDDANVTRFCDLLDEMTRRTETRFLIITHHAVTMARMDRLFGVTMARTGRQPAGQRRPEEGRGAGRLKLLDVVAEGDLAVLLDRAQDAAQAQFAVAGRDPVLGGLAVAGLPLDAAVVPHDRRRATWRCPRAGACLRAGSLRSVEVGDDGVAGMGRARSVASRRGPAPAAGRIETWIAGSGLPSGRRSQRLVQPAFAGDASGAGQDEAVGEGAFVASRGRCRCIVTAPRVCAGRRRTCGSAAASSASVAVGGHRRAPSVAARMRPCRAGRGSTSISAPDARSRCQALRHRATARVS